MEQLRTTVAQIAATADERLLELPFFHRSLLPFLSVASFLYHLSLSLRRRLYFSAILPCRRFPVPVISVGNLTWGGNGKTPMVEFIARYMDELGITPLILSRGYAGGDEAKMLQRHLSQTSVKIGIGANRRAAAVEMFERHGFMDSGSPLYSETLSSPCKLGIHLRSEMIGIVILDDGMQVSSAELKEIVSTVQKFSPALPIFFSRLAPLFLFDVKNPPSKLPLTMAINMVILCVSAIGFPDAFIQGIKKIGALHVDRIDFSDHHSIKPNDINLIRNGLTHLQNIFGVKAIVLVTEKDYDRDPVILREVGDFQIMVLSSSLQIMPFEDRTEEDFRMNLKKLLLSNQSSVA